VDSDPIVFANLSRAQARHTLLLGIPPGLDRQMFLLATKAGWVPPDVGDFGRPISSTRPIEVDPDPYFPE
jgi:hypothetical protein